MNPLWRAGLGFPPCTFPVPMFCGNRENISLKHRLTTAGSAFWGRWVYPSKGDIIPSNAPFHGWEIWMGTNKLKACTDRPFASEHIDGLWRLTAWELSKDVGNQNPKHCDESPEGGRHPRSLWGRPGLPGNLPARWPWSIPCRLLFFDGE